MKITTDEEMELQRIEVKYKRQLVIGDAEKLEVFSQDDSLPVSYRLRINTNDLLYILRISNNEKDVSLIDTVRNAKGVF